jgi:CRP-like cAMP-binding protein
VIALSFFGGGGGGMRLPPITKTTSNCGKAWVTFTGAPGLQNLKIRADGTTTSTVLQGRGTPTGFSDADDTTVTWDLTDAEARRAGMTFRASAGRRVAQGRRWVRRRRRLPSAGQASTLAPMEWRLLEGVPGEEVRRLISVARRRTFERGEVVFHQGDPADSLHLVSKGRFAVRVTTPLGDEATIAIRGAGESFGEMAIVGTSATRSATIEALESAETFSVPQTEFGRLRRDHPGVDQLLIEFLAAEVRELNVQLLDALFMPVERRVVRRLAELARVYGPVDDAVVIPLTQDELASIAGTTRPTVNQALRALELDGIVELGRGRTIIPDVAALTARAR